jgi:hypothetical protein
VASYKFNDVRISVFLHSSFISPQGESSDNGGPIPPPAGFKPRSDHSGVASKVHLYPSFIFVFLFPSLRCKGKLSGGGSRHDKLHHILAPWASFSAHRADIPIVPPCPNPYTPTSTLAQAILHASLLLTELVVREWLHDTGDQLTIPDATTFTGALQSTCWSRAREWQLRRPRAYALDPDVTT